ncbi:polymer-forming cytoskeletal protein [Niallia sp. Krafla_26]|uniref:polymer-forming cytoskeletal protein n=1 Tax=Niallia sp. Krafla_26 TaxID=3064703 RepID=UPI003D169662
MNLKTFVASLLLVGLLAGCGGNDEAADDQNTDTTTPTEEPAEEPNTNAGEGEEATNEEEQTDVNTTASIVNEGDAFVKAVSENGTWIIAILNDINIDQDVVVAGEFHDKNDATKDVYRKIALYEQDQDRNITASHTLTVPKLTIQSPNLLIKGGTVKGDIYVEEKGFKLDADAKVEGNIFYANEEVKNSAIIDGEVSGNQTVE